ncbi:hypothetical protein [Curtobacterium sp. Curtsp57]|uniref:hypothetical protein n=1 Tax=Curtobacterium sp. Curtsp57 TaxID=3243047 RepID=UPI0039B67F64
MTDTTPSTDQAQRKMFTALAKHEALVPVPFGSGWFKVPRWNATHEATGWELRGADIQLPGGRPWGSLWYVRRADGREVRVGVRWDVENEVVETLYLHRTKPESGKDRDEVDADRLELDAQARMTALQSINAFIGAQVLNLEGETAVLDAAGLGLKRLLDDDVQSEQS